MEKCVVDRIEEEYIVVENDNGMVSIPKEEIDFEVKEGDVLITDENGKYILDKEETIARKEYIDNLISDLWEN